MEGEKYHHQRHVIIPSKPDRRSFYASTPRPFCLQRGYAYAEYLSSVLERDGIVIGHGREAEMLSRRIIWICRRAFSPGGPSKLSWPGTDLAACQPLSHARTLPISCTSISALSASQSFKVSFFAIGLAFSVISPPT
jgi:hypothetical protein